MRLYVSGATSTMRKYATSAADALGCLVVPSARNKPTEIQSLGLPIAVDNGAYSGLDSDAFVRMLNAYRESEISFDWVAVPDVVGNSLKTFVLWYRWRRVVEAFGYLPAMVLQDGMTLREVEEEDPPAVFVGGTTQFKLGAVARSIVEMVRSKYRPAHMGRVNTFRRIKYAEEIGCTSFDGSGFSRWPDKRIPLGIKWSRQAKSRSLQPRLFARD